MAKPPEAPAPFAASGLLFSLDPAVAHLDTGGHGAVPLIVQRAVGRFRDELESNPSRFLDSGLAERLTHVSGHLATAVGASGYSAGLLTSVASAADLISAKVGLGAGDEVITTDDGCTVIGAALDRVCRRTAAVHRRVPVALTASPEETSAALAAVLGPRTKLAVLEHAAADSSRVYPVDVLVSALRRGGVRTAVNGTQSAGTLDVPVDRIGADFWFANLNAWSFAPRSTVLVLTRREQPGGCPVTDTHPIGRAGWDDHRRMPWSAEDPVAWLAAPTGMFAMQALGATALRSHNAQLAAFGQAVVAEALGLAQDTLPSPVGCQQLPMRIVPLPGGQWRTPAAARLLRQEIRERLRTEVAVYPWRGRGVLRLSAQVFNRPQDYRRLAEGLPGLLADLSA